MPDTRSTPTDAPLVDLARTPRLRSSLDGCLAEYAHACNNRLNSLKLSIYLARRQAVDKTTPFWNIIDSDYRELEQHFDSFATVCRPIQLNPIRLDLGILVGDREACWGRLIAERGGQFVLEPPDRPAEVRFDAQRMGQALDSLVAWRCPQLVAGSVVRLGWRREDDLSIITWSEAGSPPKDRGMVTVEGDRAWAWPVITRVLAEHGGSSRIESDPVWTVDLRWPDRGQSCDLDTSRGLG